MDNIHRNTESAAFQAKELKRLQNLFTWSMSKDKNKRKEAVRQEEKRVANAQHEHNRQMREQQRAMHPHGMPPGANPPRSRGERQSRHQRSDSQGSASSSSSAGGGERRVRPSRAHLSTSDDELETELDSNVRSIGNAVRSLNLAAQVMNKEIAIQSESLTALRANTDSAGQKISAVNTKLKKFS